MDLGILAVALLAALDWKHVLLVLLGLTHFFFDGLDARLVVVMVHFAVDHNRLSYGLARDHRFSRDGGLERLAYFGVVLAIAVAKWGKWAQYQLLVLHYQ